MHILSGLFDDFMESSIFQFLVLVDGEDQSMHAVNYSCKQLLEMFFLSLGCSDRVLEQCDHCLVITDSIQWAFLGIETPEAIITKDSFRQNFTNEGGIEDTIPQLPYVGQGYELRC